MSYGFLFYAFALLREPLALKLGLAPTIILTAISASLLIQGALSYLVGKWADHFGGLRVLAVGFFTGAIGIASLIFVTNLVMMMCCFMLIGIAIAMCTYEVAFSTVVQLDEGRSRWLISVVSFYGGIASSLAWVTLQPLLTHYGFAVACAFAASLLCLMGLISAFFATKQIQPHKKTGTIAPFHFSQLQRSEKQALIILAAANGIEYFTFAATALFWIRWFTDLFGDITIAVWLAALYGPFQVVGRLLEMQLAKKRDARITGLIAALLTPITLFMAQYADLRLAIITMIFFGIGHGILTVTFGFVTNLYFRAEIYGRAKGIIAAPRALGMASGPLIAGLIYSYNADYFMPSFIASSAIVALLIGLLLRLKPTNAVHIS